MQLHNQTALPMAFLCILFVAVVCDAVVIVFDVVVYVSVLAPGRSVSVCWMFVLL